MIAAAFEFVRSWIDRFLAVIDRFDLSGSAALAAVAWGATPYLLLERRLEWRELLPGAMLSAVGMPALSATSVIWFPRSLTASAEQFGDDRLNAQRARKAQHA